MATAKCMSVTRGVRSWIGSIGPGALVAAAFIGPGTVTTASVIGADFAYTLIWTVVFSIIATIVLQEMSARLGLITGEGLGEAFRGAFDNTVLRGVTVVLIVSAIGIGTAAFQTGNITGGAAGLETITDISVQFWSPLIGLVAGLLLWTGNYKLIERVFIALVAIMGFAFVVNAIAVRPDLSAFIAGLAPTVPDDGGIFLIAGLFGTTIVGYNLFLHASTVQEKWGDPENLSETRFDTIALVIVGGLITTAIMVTAADVFPAGTEIEDVGAMSEQLEPFLGGAAPAFFAIGLFAAGFTSAMSAPLAGAYATAGVLGWERDLTSTRFRAIWVTILVVGVVFASLGQDPVTVIVFAQVVNGILLPLLAVFLVYAMNQEKLLGTYTNSTLQNLLGIIVVLVVVFVAAESLISVIGDLI